METPELSSDTKTEARSRYIPTVIAVQDINELDSYHTGYFEEIGINGIASNIPPEVVTPESHLDLFLKLNDGDKLARNFSIAGAELLLVQVSEYEHMLRKTDSLSDKETWFYIDIKAALEEIQIVLEKAKEYLSAGGEVVIQDIIGADFVPHLEHYLEAINAAGFVVTDMGEFTEESEEKLSTGLVELIEDSNIRTAFWAKLVRQSDYKGDSDDDSHSGPNNPHNPLSPSGLAPKKFTRRITETTAAF